MKENNNTPLVTVAMVTYNSEKYVRMAIESVLASCYINIELVICDDCSSDQTWQIIMNYAQLDPRIKAMHNEKNHGEYSNRNQCILRSKGAYLIFVDGDDYLFPDSIEKCVRYFNAFPEAAFILASTGKQSMIYPVLLEPVYALKIHFFIESLFSHSFLQACFKTSVLKENELLPVHYTSGDYYTFLKIATKQPFLLINAPLGWWRVHSQQASKKLVGIKGIVENIKIHDEIFSNTTSISENEKRIVKNKQIKALIRTIIRKPYLFKMYTIRYIINYSFSAKSNTMTYEKLGFHLPILKDIHRNPYATKR